MKNALIYMASPFSLWIGVVGAGVATVIGAVTGDIAWSVFAVVYGSSKLTLAAAGEYIKRTGR